MKEWEKKGERGRERERRRGKEGEGMKDGEVFL